MLVLSRRANQSILIGNDIVVRILDIRGDHVRLGIDAPRDVTVHREEVAAEIRQSNLAASHIGDVLPDDLPRSGTEEV